ncbi:hypothetical protein HBB16_08450 [Pseudonocardia sp. MCCB 268]|nr:hypothetical protein [Pseudonocardia cytotoxica]
MEVLRRPGVATRADTRRAGPRPPCSPGRCSGRRRVRHAPGAGGRRLHRPELRLPARPARQLGHGRRLVVEHRDQPAVGAAARRADRGPAGRAARARRRHHRPVRARRVLAASASHAPPAGQVFFRCSRWRCSR